MTNSSYVITESSGRQNMFSTEPKTFHDPNYKGYGKDAERQNGRWAMIGFIAAIGSYATTGQIIPGIF